MEIHALIQALKERREALGISQYQLAEMAGVGLRTLKTLEHGKSSPTLATLSQLADVLGMSLELVIKKD